MQLYVSLSYFDMNIVVTARGGCSSKVLPEQRFWVEAAQSFELFALG